MNEIFKIVLSLSLSGSILILGVLLIYKFMGHKLSKRWQYYVWIIIALRLLIPYSPQYSLINKVIPPTVTINGTSEIKSIDDIENPANIDLMSPEQIDKTGLRGIGNQSPNVVNHLWVAWISVAVILFIRKITIYQSFAKYIKAGRTEIADIEQLNRFAEICEELGIKRPVDLNSNGLIASPLLIGIWEPRVVLPSLSVPFSELRYIYLHELIHLKRGDILYKWFLQIVLCFHWFNPLVHYMVRQANRMCELSCDECVIRMLEKKEAAEYGNTLLESLKTTKMYREPIAALTLSESAVLLQERLSSIKNYQGITRRIIALSLAFSLCLAGGGLLLGAYSLPAASEYSAGADVIPNPHQEKSENADKAVLYFIKISGANDGVWYIIGYLIPYMTNDGIDTAIALFNQNYIGSHKTASAYYDYTIPPRSDTEHRAFEILTRSLNLFLIEPLFPYMTNESIDKVIIQYNQQSGENKNPADYYN